MEGNEPVIKKVEVVEDSQPVAEAKEILAGMKRENEVLAGHIEKIEKHKATALLSGGTVAGQPAPVPVTQEEKDLASARNLVAGSGFEDWVI